MIKFNILLPALLLLIGGETLSSESEDCSELLKGKLQPRDCCKYPHRHILQTHQDKCQKACEKIKDATGGCCIVNCIYHKTSVFKDLVFSEEALLELYENYLVEEGGGKFDRWVSVVKDSIKSCAKLFPKTAEIFTCDVPAYVLDTMDCVSHFNFKNCPNFIQSTECKDLRKFLNSLDKCGREVNGTFIVDIERFDEKEESN